MLLSCWNIDHMNYFLSITGIILEYDFLWSILISLNIHYAQCSISPFSPWISFTSISSTHGMVASTWNINNMESLKLLNKHRWAFVLNLGISDSKLPTAVTSNGINKVQICHESTMLRSTTNKLYRYSINAKSRLWLLVAISTSSFLHGFSTLPVYIS